MSDSSHLFIMGFWEFLYMSIAELFINYQKNLGGFFEAIDVSQAEKLLHVFLQCSGTLIFTGVGKSGLIAEKLALTMISTGTKALFLPPLNALHGDLGIVAKDDIVILLSKSGESKELLQLLPYVQQKGAKTVAWVSTHPSKLTRNCDLTIVLPLQKELCPFGLASTTSATIQLIFGDVISMALMQEKGFSLDEYASNHPAGAIGKKLHIKVKDLMIEKDRLPLCYSRDRLRDVLVELTAKRCGCLLVVDREQRLEGIFTDGDLRRALQRFSSSVLEKPVEEMMTHHCIVTTQEQRAWHALEHMQKDRKRWVMMMPVLENERVIGLIRMHDLVQAGICAPSPS